MLIMHYQAFISVSLSVCLNDINIMDLAYTIKSQLKPIFIDY